MIAVVVMTAVPSMVMMTVVTTVRMVMFVISLGALPLMDIML